MAKKLFAVFCAAILALSLAACSKDTKATVTTKDDTIETVSSNGGFLVETGDYVYFLNGEVSAAKYKTGEITKGALVRVRKADIAAGNTADCDIIVSKLVVSDDKDAGIYLYGGYFYYAAPSTENDSKGEVKTEKILFFRTKADGSDTSKSIAGRDFDKSVDFRFVQSGDNVYLVVKDSSEIYVYDAIAREELFSYTDTKSSVQEFIFSSDAGDAAAFFSIKPVNKFTYPDEDDDNRQTENYYEVYALRFGADKAEVTKELVLDGIGTSVNGNTENKGVYLNGATFDLIRYTNGVLYYSVTSLDTTTSELKLYNYVEKANLTEANSLKYNDKTTHVTMNYGDGVADSAFGDSSMILSVNEILYVNSDQGLMLYDYTMTGDGNKPYGATRILYNDQIKGATLDFIVREGADDYLYYHNGNVYYKVNYTEIKDGKHTTAEAFRINTFDVNTSWYKPEVVAFTSGNETHYAFIATYSDDTFRSYVYVIDTTAEKAEYEEFCKEKDDDGNVTGEKSDEDKAKFYEATTKTKEKYELVAKTLLGKMTSDDAKTVEDALNED